ncbi:MAG TPA: hypothetical protein VFG61_02930 [Gaiellaceae bacterium]|nr:hypothetical protein [Gaiellaceae bacterium]
MKVEVSDPTLVGGLIESLRTTQCVVVRTGDRTFEVRFGWPTRDDASHYELDGYLRVWEAMHPGTYASRVGG